MELNFNIPLDGNSVELLIHCDSPSFSLGDLIVSVSGSTFYTVTANYSEEEGKEIPNVDIVVRILSPDHTKSLSYYTDGKVKVSHPFQDEQFAPFQVRAMCVKSWNGFSVLQGSQLVIDPTPNETHSKSISELLSVSLIELSSAELTSDVSAQHKSTSSESLTEGLISVSDGLITAIGEPITAHNAWDTESISTSLVSISNGTLS